MLPNTCVYFKLPTVTPRICVTLKWQLESKVWDVSDVFLLRPVHNVIIKGSPNPNSHKHVKQVLIEVHCSGYLVSCLTQFLAKCSARLWTNNVAGWPEITRRHSEQPFKPHLWLYRPSRQGAGALQSRVVFSVIISHKLHQNSVAFLILIFQGGRSI